MTNTLDQDVQRRTFTQVPDNEDAAALLQRLRNQTGRPNRRAARPPLYNAPDLLYTHPTTGEVVTLQGDPSSQAYYRAKGFHILTPEETRVWLTTVKPIVVAEQRKRAALITTMRRIAERHPGVEVGGDLDFTPTDELQAMMQELQTMTGGTVKVVMGRFADDTPDYEDEDSPAGEVQLQSGDSLERLKARSDAAVASGRVRGPGGKFQGAGAQV